jgi:fructose-1,6-bisphosphatase II
MERYLTLEAVRLTEAAALYASRYMGKGEEEISYISATEAMHKVFKTMNFDGQVIIGANSTDSLLADGVKVGSEEGTRIDLAVKPLDGMRTCASGGHNAVSVVAVGNEGSFPSIPSLYMEKIAVGKEAKDLVDINQPVDINIKRVARAKEKYIDDITVCVLERERHNKLVKNIRKTGAKIKFIQDGDISGAISTAFNDTSIDILMGTGGSKEAILAASALTCLDGDMQARFVFNSSKEKSLVKEVMGEDPDRVFSIGDLVHADDVMVSLTGVTDGVLLAGVQHVPGGAKTTSILLRQKTHTLRYITAIHKYDFKPIF